MAKPQTVAVEYRDAANLEAEGAGKAAALIKYNGYRIRVFFIFFFILKKTLMFRDSFLRY